MRLFKPLTVLFFLTAACLSAQPDFKAMLREIDELGSFGEEDFSCVYTIVADKPGEEQEITQARMFRRDRTDQFLILILKPEVQKGQGYLQVDENVWFYDPESRKFSHSSLKENIQNSDAKNADLDETSLAEDYDVIAWEEGTLGSFNVYILTLKALNDEVTYPKLRLWIRKDQAIVLKTEDYSLSDRLMRTSYYPKYIQVGAKLLPSQMLIVDELREGERTQITMRDATTAVLPDVVFTKAYLERVNN
ncbi:MAG: outer membrane lipoprotein-sorting protein [Spirochaetales bacterium]|nr:outer membrane lipoprotein-sorting protein [Spirochaetales bacterium]